VLYFCDSLWTAGLGHLLQIGPYWNTPNLILVLELRVSRVEDGWCEIPRVQAS
jgi:hypothetical protein